MTFSQRYEIHGIVTLGRLANVQYVNTYSLAYSDTRITDNDLQYYTEAGGQKVTNQLINNIH